MDKDEQSIRILAGRAGKFSSGRPGAVFPDFFLIIQHLSRIEKSFDAGFPDKYAMAASWRHAPEAFFLFFGAIPRRPAGHVKYGIKKR